MTTDTLAGIQGRKRYSGDEEAFQEYNSYRVRLLDPEVPLCRRLPTGQLEWNFHLGQRRVMQCKKRITAAVAGRQSGKTAVGPIWLHEEMRRRGPGMYMVVGPSYPVLIDSAIPKVVELFQTYRRLGEMRQGPPRFIVSPEGEKRLFAGTQWAGRKDLPPTIIRFGHASNPESLEAKTALAAWLDEAGQDSFKMASWEAIQGRLTTTLGRVLITTTPYNLGWLKQKIFDPWEKADKNHKDIEVITYQSILNPAFSREEYDRLRESMPFWKWDMFYNGNFTVPAGLIYGIMREKESILKCKRSDIPSMGPKYGGLDFGGPNTCAVMAVKDPKSGINFLYRTYYPGIALPIKDHVAQILNDPSARYFDRFAGGAKSEGTFRDEFWENGLRVEEPSINDVQGGIDRLYGLFAQEKLYVADDLDDWWSELYTYQYETDNDTGDVLPELKIKGKSGFHHMDATRYLGTLFSPGIGETIARGGGERTVVTAYTENIQPLLGLRNAPNNGLAQSELARSTKVARSGRRNAQQTHPRGRVRRGIAFDDSF